MTKQIIEDSINEFLKVLVYEAQFISFQKKLLHNIKDSDLKIFAEEELKKIKLLIRNGKYKQYEFSKKPILNQKIAGQVSKVYEQSLTKKILHNPNPLGDVLMTKNDFNYKNLTYGKLSKKIGVSFTFFERLLAKGGLTQKVEESLLISEPAWIIIKDFVLNKLKFIEIEKRKQKEINEFKKPKNKSYNNPLNHYVGGNFGKLIFIGKTN